MPIESAHVEGRVAADVVVVGALVHSAVEEQLLLPRVSLALALHGWMWALHNERKISEIVLSSGSLALSVLQAESR